MNRRSILDSLLLTFLLIFIIAFPVDYFVHDQLSYYLIQIVLRLLLLLYYYFSIRRSGRRLYGDENWKDIAILSPVFLVCFSNMIFFLIGKQSSAVIYVGFNWMLSLQILLDLLTAIAEEILFRFIFHNALRISNRLLRIIASAGIFAAFHALNFFGSFDPMVFVQVGYAFGLGIVLGFIMEYGNSVLICMLLHFLFNAINGSLFGLGFMVRQDAMMMYYIVNASVAAFVAIYLLIIFLVRYRKVNRLYFY